MDTDTFRPSPLPGLGEGSFNDAFGSNLNRSQGLALGATWIASSELVGEFRFGFARGNYFTYPPNVGVDAAADFGLPNVPNDPAIVGGLPKMNIQGFDAVGRHTSTPQFQTPRSWNPRATFTWSRQAHLLKFGFEFLHVQTKINDLNATIGRMNFEDRFTGRAMGDFLLGLPSQLALTSYTVMDQGQDMQFYFVQDDYRVTPKLTLNLGLRYEFATPPREKDNQLANFDPDDRDDGVRAGWRSVRARVDSSRSEQLRAACRLRLYRRAAFGRARRLRPFYSHTVRQGREGMLGFNPPYLVDNLLQTSVTGAAAVASAAPFQLRNGYPTGLLDPNTLAPTVLRRGQDPNQKTPIIHQFNVGAQYELMPDLRPRRGVRGEQGQRPARLPEPEPAGGHSERERLAVGRRAAVPGVRRHSVDGESGQLRLQLAPDRARETLLARSHRPGELHVGRGDHRCARSHLDERWRPGLRHRHVPRTARQLQSGGRSRPGRVRRQAPIRGELRVGAAVRPRAAIRRATGVRRSTFCSVAGSSVASTCCRAAWR